MNSYRTTLQATLALVCIFSIAATSADAKRRSQKTIFSSPDAEQDVVPTFVGPGGKPVNANRDLNTPGFGAVRQLPSLTKEQRKKIDDLQKDLNITLSGIRDHIASLQTKLDTMKAHPHEKVTVGKPEGPLEELPTAEQLKTGIATLRNELKQKQAEASAKIVPILTPQQLDEYQRMRRGELVISGAPRPSADPPVAAKNQSHKHHGIISALKHIFSRAD